MRNIEFELEDAKKDLIRMTNSYIELMRKQNPNYEEPEIITLGLIKDAFEYFYFNLKVKEPNFEEPTKNKKLEAFGFKSYTLEEIAKMNEEEDKEIEKLLKPLIDEFDVPVVVTGELKESSEKEKQKVKKYN